ncbi:hypothetical protein MMC09_003744 [Bachmanniomyces sp. S44760]|nr:hypothetical protein [Bachmanniomyces sp. S44760]
MESLNACIVTFNCGREAINPGIFAKHIVKELPSSQSPDIIILSLQEVAPIAYAFIGGSFISSYLNAVHHAVDRAATLLGNGRYINVITRNVGMTAMMAFVREDLVENIRWLKAAGVGVGVHEMGNKGAVGFRIGYAYHDETMIMTFIAAHLAPMEEAIDRRNEHWRSIVRRLIFMPDKHRKTQNPQRSQGTGETVPLLPGTEDQSDISLSGLYAPTSYLILAGDLNYRTSRVRPSPEDCQAFPEPTEDVTDPKHYSKLLKEDQLTKELKAGRTLHGLQEEPIAFPPTYKYSDKQRAFAETDNGTSFGWAKHRWPSWCDRVLFLGAPLWMNANDTQAKIICHKYTALPLMSTSDHRPVLASLTIPTEPITPPPADVSSEEMRVHPPFEIDIGWKERRAVARRKEITIGILAYLGLTWEGNLILFIIAMTVMFAWLLWQQKA